MLYSDATEGAVANRTEKEIPFFINYYYLCAPMCRRIDEMLLQGPEN